MADQHPCLHCGLKDALTRLLGADAITDSEGITHTALGPGDVDQGLHALALVLAEFSLLAADHKQKPLAITVQGVANLYTGYVNQCVEQRVTGGTIN